MGIFAIFGRETNIRQKLIMCAFKQRDCKRHGQYQMNPWAELMGHKQNLQ